MASDQELLSAWVEGDRVAGNDLVKRHVHFIHLRFHNKVPKQDVADLVQKTFEVCLAHKEEEIREFKHFLFGVTRRILWQYYDKARRSAEREQLGECCVADLSPSTTSLLARFQGERLLLEAMRHVPLNHQIVLELFVWEGMAGEDIAAMLGIKSATVRKRLERARKGLDQQLKRLASSPEAYRTTRTRLDEFLGEVARQAHEQGEPAT